MLPSAQFTGAGSDPDETIFSGSHPPSPTGSRDSSVGIATHYGLDGPGIESRWEARFSALVQTGCEYQAASYTIRTWSFPGVKWPGPGVVHPTPSSAEVKRKSRTITLLHPLGLRGLL